jgi:16S rRNA (uracil1498-N3)-methyltransferase
MTRRRWIADTWDQDSAALTGAQAAHLARVLRVRAGQEFDIVAGGIARRGVVESASAECVQFRLLEAIASPASLPLTCLLSVFKFDRFEWAIEKLTELGVAVIVPVLAQRTEKHLAQAAAARVDRWRRIAREATQQARRTDVPEITDPARLEKIPSPAPETLQLLLSEVEEDRTLWSALAQHALPKADMPSARIAIGPIGGWTEAELQWFTQQAWLPVSLGPRILRAETAAIATASVLAAWMESHRPATGDRPS